VRISAFLLFAILAVVSAVFAEPNLPQADDAESIEVEPPILIPNLENEKISAAASARSSQPFAPNPNRIERELERATRSAAGAERLFKIGVLAKVEVEQRFLRVVQLQADLENARLEQSRQALESEKARFARGEVSKEALAPAEQSVARAVEAAQLAAANRERAEVEAAENNLRRQRKLMALGSGRKSELARAEEKLAELKADKR